jgi:hydroxyacylglutathione hydrolase
MIFRQMLRSESGCASYLIGCVRTGQAVVVDPLADLGAGAYALEAADRGLRISYVIDTHVHADHRSAGQELARATGATLALPDGAATEYAFHPLRDGDVVEIGAVRLEVLHTPGHTPESICLLGTDSARSEQPWFLLSGDTLFPGDVGRPDLLLDSADAQARTQTQAYQLYDSLFDRLLALDDIVEVYPGHFGGSACGGVNMSGKPASTIGFERRWNLALQQRDRDTFVRFVLESLRPQPENYVQIKHENLRTWRPAQHTHPTPSAAQRSARHTLAALTPANVRAMLDEGVVLVDLRPAPDFAAAHAPGAISVPFSRAELAANLAKLLPASTGIALVADNDLVAEEAGMALREADWNVLGTLAGGMAAWWADGNGVSTLDLWPLERLLAESRNPALTIVDIREPHEWDSGVIAGAKLIAQDDLLARHHELPLDAQIVTICAGGVRSARAASLLKHLGFERTATVDRAGMSDWVKRGYPVVSLASALSAQGLGVGE